MINVACEGFYQFVAFPVRSDEFFLSCAKEEERRKLVVIVFPVLWWIHRHLVKCAPTSARASSVFSAQKMRLLSADIQSFSRGTCPQHFFLSIAFYMTVLYLAVNSDLQCQQGLYPGTLYVYFILCPPAAFLLLVKAPNLVPLVTEAYSELFEILTCKDDTVKSFLFLAVYKMLWQANRPLSFRTSCHKKGIYMYTARSLNYCFVSPALGIRNRYGKQ